MEAHALAEGLRMYSERRDEYVAEVRKVMRANRLTRFDARRLTAAPAGVWHEVLDEAGVAGGLRPIALPE